MGVEVDGLEAGGLGGVDVVGGVVDEEEGFGREGEGGGDVGEEGGLGRGAYPGRRRVGPAGLFRPGCVRTLPRCKGIGDGGPSCPDAKNPRWPSAAACRDRLFAAPMWQEAKVRSKRVA